MKKLFAFILILCAIAVFAPYWFGRQAERTYNQQLNHLVRASGARVMEERYHRGWFYSTASSDIALARAPARIVAHHRIYPGPLPADAPLKHLRSLEALQAVVATRGQLLVNDEGQALPFTARTAIRMDGSAQTSLELPAGELKLDGDAVITWQTARGRLRWHAGELHGTLTSEGLEIRTAGTNAILGLTSTNLVSYSGASGLEMGRNAITIASVEIEGATTVAIRDLFLEAQAAENEDTVGYAILAKFSDTRYAGQRFGPGKLALEFEQLDAGSLSAIRRHDDADPTEPRNALLRAITRQSAAAIGRAEIIEPGGTTSMSLKLNVAQPPAEANLRELLRVLHATVEVQAPREMIARIARGSVSSELENLASQGNIPALDETQTERIMNTAIDRRIQSWTDQGLVVRDSGQNRYLLQAVYRGGDLRVNGNSIDLRNPER